MKVSIALALLTAIAIGAPAQPASPRVIRFLGDRAAATLARASRVEVFRVKDKRASESQKSVGGYIIAAAGTEQGEPFARRVAELLLDEKSYRFDHSMVGGFAPLVGLRVWDGDRNVEVLLSFATDEVVVFSRNPEDGSTRSAQANVAPARDALIKLVKAALPDDKDVQALQPAASGKSTFP